MAEAKRRGLTSGAGTILGDRLPLSACSDLFASIADHHISRADLSDKLGVSRVTLGQRLAPLIDAGLVVELAETVPSGGRPTKMLGADPGFGVILAVDVGESLIRLAVTDLEGDVLKQSEIEYARNDPPLTSLELVASGLDGLLNELGGERFRIGMGVSLPAPIDVKARRVVGPSILRNWDEVDIVGWLAKRLGVPVVVENDVNLMTLFEATRAPGSNDHFMFIKMGTGIGSGFILDGRLYRGADGASGDIGHIQLNRETAPLCRCGKVGCLEAHAAGWAIARSLREKGIDAEDAHDVIRQVADQVPEAIAFLREAGRALGEVVADTVSILNPRTIRIGGTLAGAHEYLLAGVRELVYQRCLPLATSQLTIEHVPPSTIACIQGAVISLRHHIFSGLQSSILLERYERWQAGR
ncbi:ROK family protein [Rhizobium sp. BE258]|uniref:ROK family protein n=1 Tax=Rhizobium sp. BE258 TaxID=2817722 RepID=UPI002856217C|nr:ROK family protein [Rhizobium sp. BE258]MDR7145193.1 putative NBD/HSP70 family sugar kinase [Rhizobium sp. BE258]